MIMEISIHTPVKGVTPHRKLSWIHSRISIHTPVKGVTIPLKVTSGIIMNFNPHTREGCDRLRLTLLNQDNNFNPHTREGCDTGGRAGARAANPFQSTHP